ncbi:oligosaccharide flippase family protein [Candidatus Pacearchaeota archaeon]|nr:oligosaccharide flippase family protein [Candidatus Pacearchaeota archaeon]
MILEKIRKFVRSDLGKGAIILFITMNFYNFLNFLFHFSMGRMLGPKDYGTLAVLMSIVYLYGIPIEAIQNIIVKYTSKFNSKGERGKIKFLILKSLKKGLNYSILIFLLLFALSYPISIFLKINFWLIALTNIFIFSSFSSPIPRGVLQGRKKFMAFGNSLIVESGLKLFFAVLFVLLGFRVFGAISGVLIGVFTGIVFSVYLNRDILKEKEEKIVFNKIYSTSLPYFISMLVILIMLSLDIILAKKFFSPELAGQYAGLSMIGKMIFFGTVAISKAMFPLSSEKSEKGENSQNLFKKSFLIIAFLCTAAVGIYAFAPELIIKILYGPDYLGVSNLLIYSALSLSFLSLANLILIYGLSTNKLRFPPGLFVFIIIEITLLFLFHDNLQEYLFALMLSNAIMFIGSIFFLKRQ